MIVCDKRGRGKTDLLRKLQYQCEWVFEPTVAVALFDFENRGVTTVIDILDSLAEQLAAADVPVNLSRFDDMSRARALGDTGQFVKAWGSVKGSIDASGAQLSGEAQAAGVIQNIHIQHAENVGFPAWSDKIDGYARRLCQEIFFTDLFAAATNQPIVLLLDTIDAADTDLRRWLLRDLLKRRLLSGWEQHRLLVILAGTDVDELLQPLTAEQRACIEPAPTLANWELEQVRAFLTVHGCADLADAQLEVVRGAIAAGMSLVKAIALAGMWAEPD
jgi:hypothetical protein